MADQPVRAQLKEEDRSVAADWSNVETDNPLHANRHACKSSPIVNP
jgi:hypothetical protein